jgi:hypothetical protein
MVSADSRFGHSSHVLERRHAPVAISANWAGACLEPRSRNDSGKLTGRKSQPLIGLGHAGNGGIDRPNRSPLMMPIKLTDQARQDLIAFMEMLTDAANPVLRR